MRAADAETSRAADSRPRLVVLGSGFAGYSLIGRLPKRLFRVTMVSPANHFLFTPLLPSAAVGTVELRSILEPVRRRQPWVELLEARAERLDLAAGEVARRFLDGPLLVAEGEVDAGDAGGAGLCGRNVEHGHLRRDRSRGVAAG